jgi:tripartite-type tricarboxylate transporter receptor subunit TctC
MAGGNVGGASWVMMQKLNGMGGLKLEYVSYKGTGPALTDVVGGHVNTLMSDPASLKGYLASGQLRAIGVTAPKRTAACPMFLPSRKPFQAMSRRVGSECSHLQERPRRSCRRSITR